VVEPDDVVRQHGFHAIRVKDVVQETDDTRSFVFDVPAELRDTFRYRPGQFCTFRVHHGDDQLTRCYSMSSAPEAGDDLTVTVKRVAGGVVSNWFNDHVSPGDLLEVTRPAGTFCIRPGERPIIGFCGGSGVTPVMSIAKSVLVASSRSVDLLYANRDRGSVIFDAPLRALQDRYPERLAVRHHFDCDGGFVAGPTVVDFVGARLDADFYICGPDPFMALVEEALLESGVDPDAISIERFVTPAQPAQSTPRPASPDEADRAGGEGGAAGEGRGPASIALILAGKRHEIAYHAGDTVLETARRASLAVPSSCEAGSCATCMALVKDGAVTMRRNDALTPDEVDEGWVLTCQSVPASPSLTIEYEPL
jgi:3-ketosteroid 9alpha-monooxygenase subunit B